MVSGIYHLTPSFEDNNSEGLRIALFSALAKNARRSEPAGNLRVILLDDDEDQLLIMQTLLEKQNFKTSTSNTVWQCVTVLDERGADLLIIDSMLPGINGRSFLRLLRETEELNGFSPLPALMVAAGYAAESEISPDDPQTAFCPKSGIYKNFLAQVMQIVSSKFRR